MRAPFGFVGPTYQSLSPEVDSEDTINFYPEVVESKKGPGPLALYGTEGSEIFCNLNETSVSKQFYFNGRAFAASSHLWEVFEDGTKIDWGNLGGPAIAPVSMDASPNQLLVCNDGRLYVFDFNANSLTPVTDYSGGGQIPPISQVAYTDGYFIATIRGTNSFQTSKIIDGTIWDAINIATISLFADPIVSMMIVYREPWFFGSKLTAVYYNSGVGFPPFIPIQGAFLENGSGTLAAAVKIDNSLMWLDQDERGSMIARRANGYNPARISNHAVETAWQSYRKTSDAIGYAYQANGHSFWMIYFPSANVTWCYDVTTGMWHKRGFWNPKINCYTAHRSQCHMFAFGKHLVGDPQSGNIYNLSSKVYTDFGNPIRRLRQTPHVNSQQDEIFHHEMLLLCNSGSGPIPAIKDGDVERPPTLYLSWSDDGGHVYGNEHPASMGMGGAYQKRVVWRRLGSSWNRNYRLVYSDPAPLLIAEAYLDASGGKAAQVAQ